MKSKKLTRLEDNLRELAGIKQRYSLKDIKSAKIDEWGLRYGIFESIQIIIDIACHVVSEKNLGSPKNYSECVSVLAEQGYLSQELSKKIVKMIGLRNLMIHEYGIIDTGKLYEYLDHLNDIAEFVYAVKAIDG